MSLLPLLIVQLVLVGGLILVLRATLSRHATQATGHLKVLSQEALTQQETLKRQLEEAQRQYQEKLAKAQEEASQLKAKTLKETEEQRQQMTAQARSEAERIIQQAMAARETLQEEMAKRVESKAVEKACELIQEVMPQVLREQTHAQWLDELLKDGLIPDQPLESREEIKEAKVVSAFPLTPSQRKQIQERLAKVAGHPITLKEEVDPKIVVGLTITLGHLVVDGSLALRLREAVRHAQGAGD